MKVFVINKHGESLMPCTPCKARQLLRACKAKVLRRVPFVIQLQQGATGYKQAVTLGVDTGHTTIGISATTKSRELIAIELELRSDISDKITFKAMCRKARRSRLRYRAPRFHNRGRKGKLAPSVQYKVDKHIQAIDIYSALMPVTKLIIECAAFDIQKINNPDIKGKEYQQGEKLGFANAREYVLHRDKHTCQAQKTCCTKTLHVHHIRFRSQGGSNQPSNLICLCEKHHQQLHACELVLDNKAPKIMRAATTMSIIRNRLLKHYPYAIETFGYVTKQARNDNGLEKTHATDAFVIAGGTTQARVETTYFKLHRKNNRKMQVLLKTGKRRIRKQRHPLRPRDIISYEGKQCSVILNSGGRVYFMHNKKKISRIPKVLTCLYHQRSLCLVKNN